MHGAVPPLSKMKHRDSFNFTFYSTSLYDGRCQRIRSESKDYERCPLQGTWTGTFTLVFFITDTISAEMSHTALQQYKCPVSLDALLIIRNSK